eukprot:1147992-Pelagomonas_calceolata.AAC.6
MLVMLLMKNQPSLLVRQAKRRLPEDPILAGILPAFWLHPGHPLAQTECAELLRGVQKKGFLAQEEHSLKDLIAGPRFTGGGQTGKPACSRAAPRAHERTGGGLQEIQAMDVYEAVNVYEVWAHERTGGGLQEIQAMDVYEAVKVYEARAHERTGGDLCIAFGASDGGLQNLH